MRDHWGVTVEALWTAERAGARVARSQTAAAALRKRGDSWCAARTEDERFARFGPHLDVLHGVLRGMLDRIDAVLERVHDDAVRSPAGRDTGVIYHRCTVIDERTSLAGRVFDWYAPKFDQRLDPALADILLAADEVIRSCWAAPFGATGLRRPTGPLAYLDPRFDALATPRSSVPSDLRAPGDELVGDYVAELAIPVVALPAIAAAEPWWLALAAHETGHHVQLDLASGLVAETRAALLRAAAEPPGEADLAPFWVGWAWEVFADAFAVLAVGPAAAWAVEELQHGPPAALTRRPRAGDRYPPPAVRTALLGELARCAGVAEPGPGASDVVAWLDGLPDGAVPSRAAETIRALLAVAPQVAAALMDLSVDGVRLDRLSGALPGFAAGVDAWSDQLVGTSPVIPGRSDGAAARIGVAAAVAAFRRASESATDRPVAGQQMRLLAANVPAVLKTCGPPGTLAGAPVVDVAALAARLADRLLPDRDVG